MLTLLASDVVPVTGPSWLSIAIQGGSFGVLAVGLLYLLPKAVTRSLEIHEKVVSGLTSNNGEAVRIYKAALDAERETFRQEMAAQRKEAREELEAERKAFDVALKAQYDECKAERMQERAQSQAHNMATLASMENLRQAIEAQSKLLALHHSVAERYMADHPKG